MNSTARRSTASLFGLCILFVVTLLRDAHSQELDRVASGRNAEFASKCEVAGVGVAVRGHRELVEYRPGDLQLILAAPHGGRIAPEDYPVRESGTLVSDSNTDRLTLAIAKEVAALVHQSPHVIVCRLHRKFMDANRPLDAACDADSPAAQTWHDYQTAIEAAKQRVTQQSTRGLFIELHGHAHKKKRLEIGYLLRERDFDLPAAEFEKLQAKSSVREIAERGNVTLESLVRGTGSLGELLEKEGLECVPGPTTPSPGKDPYFNGGWNTMTHGSRDSGTISSIQIECHGAVRDKPENLDRSAKQFAAAFVRFLELHYASSLSVRK